MTERVSEVILKYSTDNTALSQTVRASQQVINLLGETRKQALTVEEAAERVNKEMASLARAKAISDLAQEASEAARRTEDWNESLRFVSQSLSDLGASDTEIQQVTRQLVEAAQAADKLETSSKAAGDRLSQLDDEFGELSRRVGLAGDAQSNLGAIRGLAGATGLGGIDQGLGLTGEVIALTEELPRLKLALSAMPDTIQAATSALGARGIGIIGALGVLGATAAIVQSEITRANAAGKLFGDTLIEIARAAEGATSDSIETQVRSLEAQNLLLESGIQAIEAQTGQTREQLLNLLQINPSDATAIGLVSELIANLGGLGGYAQSVQSATSQIQANNIAVLAWQGLLDDSATAVNDAAEATAYLNSALGDMSHSARQAAEDEKALSAALSSALGDINKNTYDAIPEIDALSANLGDLSSSAEEAKRRTAELAQQQAALAQSAMTLKETWEAMDALARQRDVFAAGQASEASERQRRQQIEEFARRNLEAEAQYVSRREELAERLRESMAEAQSAANDRVLELIDNYNHESRERLIAHQQRIADINRRAEQSAQDAISARDSVALVNARRTQQRETQEANTAYAEEERRRQVAHNRQLDQLARNLDRENQRRIQAYQRQLRDLEAAQSRERQQRADAFRRQLQQEDDNARFREQQQRAREAFERQLLEQARQRQMSDLVSGLNAERGLKVAAYRLMESDAEAHARTMRMAYARGFSGGTTGTFSNNGYVTDPGSIFSRNFVRDNILPQQGGASVFNSMRANVPISVNANMMNTQNIVGLIHREIDRQVPSRLNPMLRSLLKNGGR